MHKLRKIHFSAWLPVLLLAVLGVLMLAWVFVQANAYGQTMDEPLRDGNGRIVLGWYKSLGKDLSFITAYQPHEYVPQHGPAFDVTTTIFQRIFQGQDPWYVHSVVSGLFGVTGVAAIALCGYELAGLWGALLAALGLWLYPRYFGAIFNNPKDIPFAAAMTWVLWSVLLLIKHWESKKYLWHAMFVGVCIGFAASIRVTAVIWYGILGLMLVGWWLLYGVRIWQKRNVLLILTKQVIACISIGVISLLTMIFLWPYIALNPLPHLIESIQVMSKYPWNGTVLFAGKTYPATEIPHWYAPWWLVIGSPPALMLCLALGSIIAGLYFFKKKTSIDAKLAVIFLAFLVPLTAIVVMHAVLYGSLRQFLFVVPPMILVATYGVVQAFKFLVKYRKEVATGFVLALFLSYSLVVNDMTILHPYEYIYFSSGLVGGLPAHAKSYEVDYWGSCQKASAQWLAQNYRRYTTKQHPTVQGIVHFESLITMHLPSNFRIDEENPDFFIDALDVNGNDAYTSYHVIYTEARQGVPLCAVKAKVVLVG